MTAIISIQFLHVNPRQILKRRMQLPAAHRSPGDDNNTIAYVDNYGFVDDDGKYINDGDLGVRHTLWITY